jgi:hypothetical protein
MTKHNGVEMERDIALLRHTLATVAYRAAKALRGAPADFAEYRCKDGTRQPIQIVAHMGDLYDWALSIAQGKEKWNDAKPLPWDQETERFFRVLRAFDDYLASGAPIAAPAEKLFQGAIADSLTHIGQIAMLRRMHGAPIKGESYYRAEITAGGVGAERAAPRREFD